MTWGDVDADRRVPECEFHSVRGNHIFLWLEFSWIRILGDHIPVRFRHDDVWVVGVLEIFRTEVAIVVSMMDDHILDLSRIQANLFQVFPDLLLDGVIVRGIDQDDSFRRRYRPYRLIIQVAVSHVVEIVEDLDWISTPSPRFLASRRTWYSLGRS